MIPEQWLEASLTLPGLDVRNLHALVRAVANALKDATGLDGATIETAFLGAMEGDSFSVGLGVMMPHVELKELSETRVCLAILRKPLNIPTVDSHRPDVFLFIVSKPDPLSHLLLLAHLARLMQSRTLVDGLRRTERAEDAVALIRAAELRHAGAPRLAASIAPHAVVIVSISGEKAVDALMVELVDHGLGNACVLEAQSLREAAAREVPLFAGFRDLFGDPGGRRMLVLEIPADRVDDILELVRRTCEEYRARDAYASVVPVQSRWALPVATPEEDAGGH